MFLSWNCPVKNEKTSFKAFSLPDLVNKTIKLSFNNKAIKSMIRTFFSGFLRPPGSMTVEAALILPLFLFLMMSILYIFQVLHLQTKILTALHQEGNSISLQAYGDQKDLAEEIVFLVDRYQIEPFLFWPDFINKDLEQRYYGHAWIGYDLSGEAYRQAGDGSLSPYVFIAATGSVYHRQSDCTYLDLSVRSVGHGEINDLRNKGGEKYYACELCGNGEDTCYLTDYGNRYHNDPVCGGLKRTVYRISMNKAIEQGRYGCSKCGV